MIIDWDAHHGNGTQHAFDARIHPADGEAPGLFVLEFEIE